MPTSTNLKLLIVVVLLVSTAVCTKNKKHEKKEKHEKDSSPREKGPMLKKTGRDSDSDKSESFKAPGRSRPTKGSQIPPKFASIGRPDRVKPLDLGHEIWKVKYNSKSSSDDDDDTTLTNS